MRINKIAIKKFIFLLAVGLAIHICWNLLGPWLKKLIIPIWKESIYQILIWVFLNPFLFKNIIFSVFIINLVLIYWKEICGGFKNIISPWTKIASREEHIKSLEMNILSLVIKIKEIHLESLRTEPHIFNPSDPEPDIGLNTLRHGLWEKYTEREIFITKQSFKDFFEFNKQFEPPLFGPVKPPEPQDESLEVGEIIIIKSMICIGCGNNKVIDLETDIEYCPNQGCLSTPT